MRIIIDGRLYGLENAGLGRYTINLVEYLQKIDNKNKYYLLLRKKYFDELKLRESWTKVLADFRHYSIEEQLKLPSIIAKINPDLTHFLHFNVPIFWRGKFIVTIHDMLMHKYAGLSATTLPGPIYWIKRLAYKAVFNHAIKNSVKIIVPSRSVKNEILNYYKIPSKKVEITYEGVDNEVGMKDGKSILTANKINSEYIIYSGNAYPHKNLDRLIEVVVNMNKKGIHKLILAIVSSRNVFTQRLDSLIRRIDGGEYVKILGFVPDERLGYLYQHSVAFIAPSLSEGFGLPALEAMQSGTLVLASDIPVFREIYKESAKYFDPLNSASIENIISESTKISKQEREKMIKKGKALAETYSWDKMAKETLNIYEEFKSSDSIRQGK